MYVSMRSARALAATFILAALGSMGQAQAGPVTQGFEGLSAGTVVCGTSTFGPPVQGDPYVDFDIIAVGNQGPSSAIIFDTAHPTGNDPDLGTPNQSFGGPGVGVGGLPGTPGENRVARNKVMIIPKYITDANRDGKVDDPNDSAFGGSLTFVWAAPVLLNKITVVDFEESGGVINQFRNGQLVASFPIIPLGDNCQITIPTMTRQFIDRTQIIFPGSGALAELVYDFSPLPVQQTTWGTIKSLYEAQ